jgi:hypothetical protein
MKKQTPEQVAIGVVIDGLIDIGVENEVSEMMAFPKAKWSGKKPRSLKALDATLWRWFSAFIRLRDAGKDGMCKCITCGRSHHWKEMDAGHFITRNHKATKFDEKNVHAQCVACNQYGHGEQYSHGIAIDNMYGAGTSETLKALGSVSVKLDCLWYEAQIEKYKAEVKKMLNEIK